MKHTNLIIFTPTKVNPETVKRPDNGHLESVGFNNALVNYCKAFFSNFVRTLPRAVIGNHGDEDGNGRKNWQLLAT